jgi:hypothetical protein
MLRLKRNTQIPLRNRSNSPPRLSSKNNGFKRPRIDTKNIERANADQALALIAAAPEDASKPPTLIPSEIPEFEANYVKDRAGYSRYTGFPEYQLFALFFTEKIG